MNLSEHFTKEELIYSDTAKAKKISNEPSAIHLKTLTHTCQYFLEPLRKLFNDEFVGKVRNGKTVKYVYMKITSGYRSSALNNAIPGSSSTSQHSTGEAVDFEIILVYTNGTRETLYFKDTYKLIKGWVKANKISIDQLIQEQSGSATWVHGSYKAGGSTVNRKQFLIYEGGKYRADS